MPRARPLQTARDAGDSEPAALFRFQNAPVLIAMVWKASPRIVLGIATLRLARAVFPVAMLWTWMLVIDTVVRDVRTTGAISHYLWALVLLECALGVSNDVAGRAVNLLMARLAGRFNLSEGVRFMDHADTLDLATLDDPARQDMFDRARGQSGQIAAFAALTAAAQDTLTLVLFVTVLYTISAGFASLMLLVTIPECLATLHFARQRHRESRIHTADRRLLEYLRNLPVSPHTAKEVKTLGIAPHLTALFADTAARLHERRHRLVTRHALIGGALRALSIAAYYGTYAVGLAAVMSGRATLGSLLIVMRSITRSRQYVDQIVTNLSEATVGDLRVGDLLAYFEAKPTLPAVASGRCAPRPIVKGLEFEHVTFCYPDGPGPVLQDVNLVVRPGETLAVVGESGAGKTTLVKLMAGLYAPTDGRITLDGVDLRDYDPGDLRRQIGIVWQDYVRYDLTVRQNIGFGCFEALDDDARLDAAARASAIDGVIGRWPRKYDQMLGRRFAGGVRLSGGEWQRIALARAYFRDPQILILDEPTAALDPRTERVIFEQCAKRMRQRLVVLISHRLSTVRTASHVVMLKGGRVREHGTHPELMAGGGAYAHMFASPSDGLRP
jgi:ATP-binding cassette subfamily B protein